MADKIALDFAEIAARLKACTLPDVDRVVGIGSGGVVPAVLAAYELGAPLSIMTLNLRAPDNTPRHPRPVVLSPIEPPAPGERILLVDDVSVSGATLDAARALLPGAIVTTLVMKGRADIVLFPEVAECVTWPWQRRDG